MTLTTAPLMAFDNQALVLVVVQIHKLALRTTRLVAPRCNTLTKLLALRAQISIRF